MALSIPSTLKLAHLKHIAFKCGISSSGTKPILTQRLHDEIASVSPCGTKTKPSRILSIDMGIRNLAYCVLDVPSKKVPVIQAWQRLAVSSPPSDATPTVKESFSPATLSSTAYDLLRHRLLLLKPTHILIERQRFRSMGSKHILEWTVRVNMFESILYGVLCTLKGENIWDGSVEAIAPGKVGPFWIDEEREEKGRKAKGAKAKNKGAKIDLVRQWLEDGEMLGLGNEEVEGVARAYRDKWDGKRYSKVKDGEDRMGKLDDLADSMLQGIAWVRWEENKRVALRDGVEALLEPGRL
ncbi:Cruciform cutting endonuclease 1, mitochondrial [Lachnellula cervina]|uniref:Cruciform cutting endonuclease 1, mitochondrial n=1 Tax=Lachnellula cervina TaxID=1316786 RepID=A0A7D8YJ95_9HELO|nr:Cruciform cutting endonuclease 1, mitochondrial [Lachnellula cervina]